MRQPRKAADVPQRSAMHGEKNATRSNVMSNPVRAIPEGYHAVTPSLTCKDAARAIEFYKQAFGAVELFRMPSPDGKVAHSEIMIGDSHVMINDEFGPAAGAPSGTPRIYLFLYVENSDAFFNRAVAGGAKVDMPLENMFWGDRFGKLTDPFGHQWGIATHVEDVTPQEMQRRSAAWFAKAAGQS
jgi:PhnB protein